MAARSGGPSVAHGRARRQNGDGPGRLRDGGGSPERQRGAASGGEHVGEQLGFGGLAGGHARGQGAHRGGGGVLGGVLEHRQAALVVAQHQAQEQGVELGGGGAAQGVEFGGGGHAGHGGHRAGVLVRTPVVTAVAVAVAHPAHVPLHRL